MILQPLPNEVTLLLDEYACPPRLHVHLALVHGVARQLTQQIFEAWPNLSFDENVVHLGAASHDIGKALHRQELSEPGRLHEGAGRKLLTQHGWPESLARIAESHGQNLCVDDALEDVLVAIADKIWKGKRDDELEQVLVHQIATRQDQRTWLVWLTLDEILTKLAEPASERIQWQANFAA